MFAPNAAKLAQDFNKGLKYQVNNIAKSGTKHTTKIHPSSIQGTTLFNDQTERNNIKEFSELYSLKNGIGKI